MGSVSEIVTAAIVSSIINRLVSSSPPKNYPSEGQMRIQKYEKLLAHAESDTDAPTVSVPSPIINQPSILPTPLFTSGNVADRSISISCVACAQAHLATVSGLLKEAIRFGRTGGVGNPEVVTRLITCLEEITALERHDWSEENLLASEPKDVAIVRQFQERVRVLRQHITQVVSIDQLQATAQEAGILVRDFGFAVMQSRGVDTTSFQTVAEKVKAGESTPAQGISELKSQAVDSMRRLMAVAKKAEAIQGLRAKLAQIAENSPSVQAAAATMPAE